MSKKEIKGGVYQQIKEGNEFTIQMGQLSYLGLMEVMGIELTPEQLETYERLQKGLREEGERKKARFLEKWGENVVKLHEWLEKEFGRPFTRNLDEAYKSWRIKDMLDNADQSETIYLD